ncbi:MAG: type III secretion system chaperone [Pseudomonadota bacterium]
MRYPSSFGLLAILVILLGPLAVAQPVQDDDAGDPPPFAGQGPVLPAPGAADQDDNANDDAVGNSAVAAAARLRDAVGRIDPGAEFSERGALFRVAGVEVTLVYDINANRMRLVAPVARITDIDDDVLVRLMQANFDSALDARYALAQGVVWSTFIHPLASLTLDDFASGIGQTVNLVSTFGSSYSSGALIFGGGDSAAQQQQRELIEELRDKSRDI